MRAAQWLAAWAAWIVLLQQDSYPTEACLVGCASSVCAKEQLGDASSAYLFGNRHAINATGYHEVRVYASNVLPNAQGKISSGATYTLKGKVRVEGVVKSGNLRTLDLAALDLTLNYEPYNVVLVMVPLRANSNTLFKVTDQVDGNPFTQQLQSFGGLFLKAADCLSGSVYTCCDEIGCASSLHDTETNLLYSVDWEVDVACPPANAGGGPAVEAAAQPTFPPTWQPSPAPTAQPSAAPSNVPTMQPSAAPTYIPTKRPTAAVVRCPDSSDYNSATRMCICYPNFIDYSTNSTSVLPLSSGGVSGACKEIQVLVEYYTEQLTSSQKQSANVLELVVLAAFVLTLLVMAASKWLWRDQGANYVTLVQTVLSILDFTSDAFFIRSVAAVLFRLRELEFLYHTALVCLTSVAALSLGAAAYVTWKLYKESDLFRAYYAKHKITVWLVVLLGIVKPSFLILLDSRLFTGPFPKCKYLGRRTFLNAPLAIAVRLRFRYVSLAHLIGEDIVQGSLLVYLQTNYLDGWTTLNIISFGISVLAFVFSAIVNLRGVVFLNRMNKLESKARIIKTISREKSIVAMNLPNLPDGTVGKRMEFEVEMVAI